ncbi:MAG: EAL domain-containing protein [Acidimicrobiia bacterium]|nr:EAL domain-containing protein [Acidimicrobiia bacterium]
MPDHARRRRLRKRRGPDAATIESSAYRAIIERTPDTIFRYRFLPTPAFEYIGPQIADRFGITQAELYADPNFAWDRALAGDRGALAMLGEPQPDGIVRVRCRFRGDDGTAIHTELSAVQELDPEGRVAVLYGLIRDITAAVLTDASLRDMSELFSGMFANSPLGLALVDHTGRIESANPALARMTGRDTAAIRGLRPTTLVQSRDELDSRDCLEGRAPACRARLRRNDDETIWVEITTRAHTPPTTATATERSEGRYFLQFEDITRKRAAEARQQDQARILEMLARGRPYADTMRALASTAEGLLEGAHCAVLWTEGEGPGRHVAAPSLPADVVLRLESKHLRLAWLASEEPYPGITDIASSPAWDHAAPSLLAGGYTTAWTVPVTVEMGSTPDGLVVMFLSADRKPDESETEILDFVASITAIAVERMRTEELLSHQSTHDPLTGLPNRTLLEDRLEVALSRMSRGEGQVALLFLDIDRFKTVNDSLGHRAGDTLLTQVAHRLLDVVASTDTVARFGGDEFVVVSETTGGVHQTVTLAERLSGQFAAPFHVGGRQVHLAASIGIAIGESPDEGAHRLLRDADTALFRAKEQGGGRSEVFDERLRSEVLERLEIEHLLRGITGRDELRVRYQPVVDLAHGCVTGFEALVRWEHPLRGEVPPDRFIPAAEETGLIVDIGETVLREACGRLAEWTANRPDTADMTISVNLSPVQFSQPDLPGRVEAVLEEVGLEPHRLCLEITESAIMRDEGRAIRNMQELAATGVRFALDDFGTGYSSLGYLARLPVDIIKLDRSFVAHMDHADNEVTVVLAVIAIAEQLGLEVVAEGVETREQAKILRTLGCGVAQGYFFDRPLATKEAEDVLGRRYEIPDAGPPQKEKRNTVTRLLDDWARTLDLTSQVELDSTVRSDEQHLERVAELTHDIVYRLDLTQGPRLSYVSPNIVDLLGVSADEMMRQPSVWHDLVVEEDRPGLPGAVIPASGDAGRRDLLRCRHADGHLVWVEASYMVIRDADGRPLTIEGIVRDMTVLVRARRLLTEALDLLELQKVDPPLASRMRSLLVELTRGPVGSGS